jgi:hypothetical protein
MDGRGVDGFGWKLGDDLRLDGGIWLVHRDGIVRVIFELRTHWAPNIETK